MGTINALSILKLVGGMINAFYAIAMMLFTGIIIAAFIPSYTRKLA